MADRLGITSSAYGKIERGESRLDIDRLKQIAEALEIDVIDLLNEEGIIAAYNGDCSVNGYNTIKSYQNSEAKAWERMFEHFEKEITDLKQQRDQLLKLVEKLSTK